MKINNIKKIETMPSRCFSVESNDKLYTLGNNVLSHNSVAQRNIIMSCIMRQDKWVLLGIDLKRVELTMWRHPYRINVATTFEDAALFTRFVQSTMMARYTKMEQLGINNWDDMPEDQRGPALMLMVDELGELLAPIKGKSDEMKTLQEQQEEVSANLASIARLGRAAQVFIVLATQRPSADLIDGQLRDNLSNRVVCGNVKSNISKMMFDNTMGTRIKGKPMGRIGVQISGGQVVMAQGFFAPEEWLDEYFEAKGGFKPVNNSGSMEGIGEVNEASENPSTAGSQKRAEDDWDEDMEDIFNEVDNNIEF